jgi:mannose-1-phosphate guanylyltransferase
VVNGDTLTDLDMGAVYRQHSSADALTVCAQHRGVDVDFGVLEGDGDYLEAYVEKPKLSYRVSMGINVVSTWAIRKYSTSGTPLDTPELVTRLLRAGEPVRVLETPAFWLDLGRIKDLEAGVAAFEAAPRRFLPD